MKPGENSAFLPELKFEQMRDKPRIVICIPACNEISLIPVFNSLNENKPTAEILVLVYFNASENASTEIKKNNENAFQELKDFVLKNQLWFDVAIYLNNDFPSEKSGVGLARKSAMDKACEIVRNNYDDGVLICLDADCRVENNYISSIENYFLKHSKIQSASIYFEHPEPENIELRKSIYLYELHLRYLKNAWLWCGFPWYYYTVGSSMAVRVSAYLKNGGMNTRKAGEDFYFLQKLMPLGFGEINDTTVFPEARFSDRVPFGTGRSMLELRDSENELNTYSFEIFIELKKLFDSISFHKKPIESELKRMLHPMHFEFQQKRGIFEAWENAVNNTSDLNKALARFYKWFSGFTIIRCMHFLRDQMYPDVPVEAEAMKFLEYIGKHGSDPLQIFRKMDRT